MDLYHHSPLSLSHLDCSSSDKPLHVPWQHITSKRQQRCTYNSIRHMPTGHQHIPADRSAAALSPLLCHQLRKLTLFKMCFLKIQFKLEKNCPISLENQPQNIVAGDAFYCQALFHYLSATSAISTLQIITRAAFCSWIFLETQFIIQVCLIYSYFAF